jgi:hypothetical protein
VPKRYVAPILACLALAAPAGASAHARTPTVALDYRIVLDAASRSLPGVAVDVLDGDRSLRVSARATNVTVLGDLHEPMLRIGPRGAFANRASATAVAQRLVASGRGWQRVGGSTFAWHDHRLSPPPYDGGRAGPVAALAIPIVVDGRRASIAGSFVRYRRPSTWPWLAASAAGAAAAVLFARLARRRRETSIALGAAAGIAAVASLASFNAADSPTGRVAWVELVLAGIVAGAALVAIVRSRGERRTTVAGLIGAAAAATTLGSIGVFRHAVVIAAFPASLARALCAVALAGGVAAAATGIVMRSEP